MNDSSAHFSRYAGKIIRFYIDGFKSMTIGKKLWAIIIVKLIVLFLVLRIFFFPNILSERYSTDEQRSDAIRSIMTERQL